MYMSVIIMILAVFSKQPKLSPCQIDCECIFLFRCLVVWFFSWLGILLCFFSFVSFLSMTSTWYLCRIQRINLRLYSLKNMVCAKWSNKAHM